MQTIDAEFEKEIKFTQLISEVNEKLVKLNEFMEAQHSLNDSVYFNSTIDKLLYTPIDLVDLIEDEDLLNISTEMKENYEKWLDRRFKIGKNLESAVSQFYVNLSDLGWSNSSCYN